MRTYRIDMIPGKVGAVINASQYDYGYEVQVTLYEGSVTYQIPSGASIRVEGTKSDAKGFSYECRAANGIVYVPIQIQMTAVQGDVPCELVVYKNGLRVGSCNFILAVEESALDGDTDISETDIPAIIAEATEQMEAAASSASQAAASATAAATSVTSAETAKTAAMDAAQDAIDAAQELQTAIQFNAALIHETASGAVASFADGADDIPMQSVVAEITPVQDLNGQSNPYPPGGGKNIAQINNIDIPATVGSQRTVDISSPIALSAGTYTLSWTFTGNVTQTRNQPLYAIDNVQTYSNKNCSTSGRYSWTFTLASDATLTFRWWANDLSAACSATDFMLEKGSTATAYAPYSNICPISGRTGMTVTRAGKNLLNPALTSGLLSITIGALETDITPSGRYAYTERFPSTEDVVLSIKSSEVARCEYAKIVQYVDGVVVAVATNVNMADTTTWYTKVMPGRPNSYCRIVIGGTNLSPGGYIHGDAQIEIGSTATEYEPYNATEIPITWETEAGTVYGGTLDVVSGVLTVDKGFAKFSDKTWTVAASRFYCEITDTKEPQTQGLDFVCSAFARANVSDYATMPDNTAMLCPRNFSATRKLFVVRADAYASASDFLTAMGGQTLVYPLATPQTYQLTPTEVRALLGGNTIYTDAGSVSVEYVADTKLYIDNKIAELQALVLEN